MKHKSCIIITLLVIISFFSILLPSVSSQDGAVIDISMPDGETQTRFDEPKLIAGTWHYINVTVINQDVQKLTLKFYEGSSVPTGTKNATNYYEWVYDKSNATQWMDAKKYDDVEYIDIVKCVKNNNVYSFYIGIKDTFPNDISYDDGSLNIYHENWTLEIYKDDDTQLLYSENIVIEKPTISIAKTGADYIYFYVDPFTIMDTKGDDEFRIRNGEGNLPLNVIVNYSEFDYLFDILLDKEQIWPGDTVEPNITLYSESWPPGEIGPIEGIVACVVPEEYIIQTSEMISFTNSLSIDAARLTIRVGHSGYKLVQLGDSKDSISFEYPESISMYEGQIKDDLYVYISGKGSVKLDVTSENENIKILNLLSEGNSVNSPFTFVSSATSEHTITVKVEAISEGKTGTIIYTLETDDGTYTYTTDITIDPPRTDGDTSSNADSTLQIIVLISIILVIIYMVFSHIKHRRR